MSVKRLLAGLAVLCSVYFGALSGAVAVSLDEFDRMTNVEKDRLMFTVLHFYYYRYADNPETSDKASCMRDLNERKMDGGDPYLEALIMRDLQDARIDAAKSHTVEAVVKAVIDRECETP